MMNRGKYTKTVSRGCFHFDLNYWSPAQIPSSTIENNFRVNMICLSRLELFKSLKAVTEISLSVFFQKIDLHF